MSRLRPPSTAAGPQRRPNVSLARALSKLGLASRTAARGLIASGRIRVNGQVVHEATRRVDPARDRITLDELAVRAAPRRYLAFNKPRGVVTTTRDEQGRRTVYDVLDEARGGWLAPVGRLDKASEGLLLFTNDTAWASRILDPGSRLAKLYHVQVARHLTIEELEALRHGVLLDDNRPARAEAVRVLRAGASTCWLEIRLHEGRNRQIRRMLATLGAEVLRLVRVAIGPVELGALAKGEARPLSPAELAAIAAAL
jgi:23S rRNA pseudouridine2605 synthase